MFSKTSRRLLIFTLILAVIVVAIPNAAEPSISYAQDNTITIGTLDIPANLDPADADSFVTWEILSHLYTGLTRQVPGTNTYELALASDHQVADDGLTHTFTVRTDTTFTDGTPITAETFADSINRIIRLDRNAAALMTEIESVTATAEDTLEFTLNRPNPYFEGLLSLPIFFAYHPDDFPSNDVNRSVESLIGNGVYSLDSWNPGDFISLRANPDYQLGDLAKTEIIQIQKYFATENLRLALVNGEVDVAWRDVLLPDAVRTAEENANINIYETPSIRMWYLYITGKPEFDLYDDTAIRQVMVRLIDRERITTDYFDGHLTAAYSLVPQQLEGAHTNLWQEPLTGDEAVAVLIEGGIQRRPTNQLLGVSTSQTLYGDYYANAVANIIRDYAPIRLYITIGVNTFPNIAPVTALRSYQDGSTPSFVFAYTPIVMHPDAYLRALTYSDGYFAVNAGFTSSVLDGLLDSAAIMTDQEEQDAAYREIQELVYPDYNIAPMWQDTVSALASDSISGVTVEANMYLHYDLLEKQ